MPNIKQVKAIQLAKEIIRQLEEHNLTSEFKTLEYFSRTGEVFPVHQFLLEILTELRKLKNYKIKYGDNDATGILVLSMVDRITLVSYFESFLPNETHLQIIANYGEITLKRFYFDYYSNSKPTTK